MPMSLDCLEVRRAALAAVAFLACASLGVPGSASGRAIATSAVKLVRAEPAIVRRACRDAQKHVRVRVTCPTLIPATRYMRIGGLHGEIDFSPSLWAITFNNGDNGSGYVHWIAGGGTFDAIGYYLLGDAVNEVKGRPRLVSRVVRHGYPVTTYEYPAYPAGGPNGGHTAAFVRCGRGEVFASIHGYGHEPAVTAMAVDLARRSGCGGA